MPIPTLNTSISTDEDGGPSSVPALFSEGRTKTRTEGKLPPVPEAWALSDPFFEIYRADKVRITSTLFSGGDWRWQFSVASGVIVARGAGFGSEMECRAAVTALRRNSQSAKIFSRC